MYIEMNVEHILLEIGLEYSRLGIGPEHAPLKTGLELRGSRAFRIYAKVRQ